ncbi:MAG: TolC family protein [Flavobacteriaceae bacterium]|nr:TolC family protein [Flavobacteriaceae bacterium]
MKQLIIISVILIAFNTNLFSQNIDKILSEIETNNTTLAALRKKVEADKIGNKTGIYLQNPEIAFNYLWGSPAATGNRTDINFKQTFDFPTTYSYKNQIADIKNEQVDLEYHQLRKDLLLKSRLICFDLVYTNSLKIELSKRLSHAQNMATSYQKQFDLGETNILALNKAQLNLLNLSNEMELLNIERNVLLGELTQLNGGIFIDFTASEYPVTVISENFEQWYQQQEQSNPLLNWLKKEVEISQKQLSLNNALSLPKFEAGYISESVVGQEFQGFTVGISIPLWEHKNTVKYSKANAIAVKNLETDRKLQLYNHLKTVHQKVIELQKNTDEYQSKLQLFNNVNLLYKALEKGEMNLIDYIIELSVYYESVNKLLELKRDYHKTVAALNQYL